MSPTRSTKIPTTLPSRGGLSERGSEPWPSWASEPVRLVDPDSDWAGRGEQERAHLEGLLAPWLTRRIEHVGSTTVPGLPAKPIIDRSR